LLDGADEVTRIDAIKHDPFGTAAAVLFMFWIVATGVVAFILSRQFELNREIAALLGWILEDSSPVVAIVACAWLVSAPFTAIPGMLIASIGIVTKGADRSSRLSMATMAAHGMTAIPWIAVALGL
jgi:hypothetical protein